MPRKIDMIAMLTFHFFRPNHNMRAWILQLMTEKFGRPWQCGVGLVGMLGTAKHGVPGSIPERNVFFLSCFFLGQFSVYKLSHAVEGARKPLSGFARSFHSMWIFKFVVFSWIMIIEIDIMLSMSQLKGHKPRPKLEGRGWVTLV